MLSIYDIMHDERRYGYVLDKRYDWLNICLLYTSPSPRD